MARSLGSGTPTASRMVGKTSIEHTGVLLTLPAGITPGQRTMNSVLQMSPVCVR